MTNLENSNQTSNSGQYVTENGTVLNLKPLAELITSNSANDFFMRFMEQFIWSFIEEGTRLSKEDIEVKEEVFTQFLDIKHAFNQVQEPVK